MLSVCQVDVRSDKADHLLLKELRLDIEVRLDDMRLLVLWVCRVSETVFCRHASRFRGSVHVRMRYWKFWWGILSQGIPSVLVDWLWACLDRVRWSSCSPPELSWLDLAWEGWSCGSACTFFPNLGWDYSCCWILTEGEWAGELFYEFRCDFVLSSMAYISKNYGLAWRCKGVFSR